MDVDGCGIFRRRVGATPSRITVTHDLNPTTPLGNMFSSIRAYVSNRKRGLATAAGFVGGLYLLGQYVIGRLEEVRDKVVQDRAAREK